LRSSKNKRKKKRAVMTNLIFIHGVSSQTTGFSNTLYKNILKSYKNRLVKNRISKSKAEERAQSLIQKEILWADVTTDLTNQYLTWQLDISKRPGKWNFLIKQIDPLVMQILFYVKDKGDKKTGLMSILEEVADDFKKTCSNNPDKVVIIAHSLGSVIAFDYVFGFRKYKLSPKVNVEALVTLGSPIPIFNAGMGHVESEAVFPPNVKRWINILDPDDGIARYCRRYFKNLKVEDKEINTGFGPLSAHAGYWKSEKVAELIAENLINCGV